MRPRPYNPPLHNPPWLRVEAGSDFISPTMTFSRASPAYYNNLATAPAAVNVPRFQSGTSGFVFSSDTILSADRQARAASTALAARSLAGYQPLIAGLNVILFYGQSNAAGTQAFPPQRLTPVSGLSMLGDSTRGTAATTHTPFGTAVLKPMVATVLSVARDAVIDATAIAALDYSTSNNLGETNCDAATMRLRQRMLALNPSDARELVVIDCAEPGVTAATLSRGASPSEFFNRIPTGIAQLAAAAASAGKAIRVVAVVYHQGEADCGVTASATWQAQVEQIMADVMTYGVTPSIPAQVLPPLPFMIQIGGLGVIGNDDLTIPQATLAMAQRRGWPIVPRTGTAKGLHMDVNGAGETGILLSRKLFQALVLRHGTIDNAPYVTGCKASGNEVLITFTAAAAMLARTYYAGWTPTDRADLGIRLTDSTGVLTVSSAVFVGSRTVRMVVNRAMTGGSVNVGIGFRNTSAGKNNLGVANAEATGFTYAFSADMNPAANVPALVGLELDRGDFSTLSTFDLVVA